MLSSATRRMAQFSFWEELKNVGTHGPEQETPAYENISAFEFEQLVRFVQRTGGTELLRVIWKICKEDAFVALSNWLVFDATLTETLRLCQLVKKLLLALPAQRLRMKPLQRRNDQSTHESENENFESRSSLVSAVRRSADCAKRRSQCCSKKCGLCKEAVCIWPPCTRGEAVDPALEPKRHVHGRMCVDMGVDLYVDTCVALEPKGHVQLSERTPA